MRAHRWVPGESLDGGVFEGQHREHYRLLTESGSCDAQLSGRLRHTAALGEHQVVGDWVARRRTSDAQRAVIEGVLTRRGALMRRRADRSAEPQLIAANLDRVFVVSPLNADFEPRRIERALTLIWEAGAEPVIVLTNSTCVLNGAHGACSDGVRHAGACRVCEYG